MISDKAYMPGLQVKKFIQVPDQDYYDYVMEFPKRMYIEASYDENKIYINAYVDKVDEPVINVK